MASSSSSGLHTSHPHGATTSTSVTQCSPDANLTNQNEVPIQLSLVPAEGVEDGQTKQKKKKKKKLGSRGVTFDEETMIDNEHMGKKSSKCCCVYEKPLAFGESSSEDEDDCKGCRGHRHKKNVPENPNTDGSREHNGSSEANCSSEMSTCDFEILKGFDGGSSSATATSNFSISSEDQIEISLSLNKSLLQNLGNNHTKLLLINSLLTQCMGTINIKPVSGSNSGNKGDDSVHSSGNGGGGQTRGNCSPIVSHANDGTRDDHGSRNDAIKQESLNLQQGNSQQNENDQMSANAQQTCHLTSSQNAGTKVFPPPPLPPSAVIRGSQFSPFSDSNAATGAGGHHRDANNSNSKSSASSNVLQGSAVSVMANQLKEIAPSNHLQSLVDQNNLVEHLAGSNRVANRGEPPGSPGAFLQYVGIDSMTSGIGGAGGDNSSRNVNSSDGTHGGNRSTQTNDDNIPFSERCSVLAAEFGTSTFQCKQCMEYFPSARQLCAHSVIHIPHAAAAAAAMSGGSVSGSNAGGTKRSMPTNENHNSFAAAVMNETMSQPHNKYHSSDQQSRRKYSCPECNFTSDLMTKVSQHMIMHSEMRPHECQLCNKRFKRRYHLDRHLGEVHMGGSRLSQQHHNQQQQQNNNASSTGQNMSSNSTLQQVPGGGLSTEASLKRESPIALLNRGVQPQSTVFTSTAAHNTLSMLPPSEIFIQAANKTTADRFAVPQFLSPLVSHSSST